MILLLNIMYSQSGIIDLLYLNNNHSFRVLEAVVTNFYKPPFFFYRLQAKQLFHSYVRKFYFYILCKSDELLLVLQCGVRPIFTWTYSYLYFQVKIDCIKPGSSDSNSVTLIVCIRTSLLLNFYINNRVC